MPLKTSSHVHQRAENIQAAKHTHQTFLTFRTYAKTHFVKERETMQAAKKAPHIN